MLRREVCPVLQAPEEKALWKFLLNWQQVLDINTKAVLVCLSIHNKLLKVTLINKETVTF